MPFELRQERLERERWEAVLEPNELVVVLDLGLHLGLVDLGGSRLGRSGIVVSRGLDELAFGVDVLADNEVVVLGLVVLHLENLLSRPLVTLLEREEHGYAVLVQVDKPTDDGRHARRGREPLELGGEDELLRVLASVLDDALDRELEGRADDEAERGRAGAEDCERALRHLPRGGGRVGVARCKGKRDDEVVRDDGACE